MFVPMERQRYIFVPDSRERIVSGVGSDHPKIRKTVNVPAVSTGLGPDNHTARWGLSVPW